MLALVLSASHKAQLTSRLAAVMAAELSSNQQHAALLPKQADSTQAGHILSNAGRPSQGVATAATSG